MNENRPYFESGDRTEEVEKIIEEFALCMKRGDSPDSSVAQSTVEKWKYCLGNCPELLGIDSVNCDIESYGRGTTQYMNDAIEFYRRHGD